MSSQIATALPRWQSPIVIVGKVLFVLVLPLLGSMGHAVALLLLAGWALRGPRQAIEALTLTWLATFLNPGIYSLSGHEAMLRWLVIGMAFTSIAARAVLSPDTRNLTVPKVWYGVVAFCMVAVVLSLHTSFYPDVSVFKVCSFLLGATAVLFGFHFTRHMMGYWRQWFLTFFAVVLIVGFPLIVHDLGYVRNGSGFQGLSNHPQAYAVFVAPLFAWLGALLISGDVRGRFWFGVLGIALVSLIATEARTGVFAVIVGSGPILLWKYLQVSRIRSLMTRLVPALMVALVLGVTGAILADVDVRGHVVDFVMKTNVDQYDGFDMDETTRTRRPLMERSMANFYEQPLLGIGFGVQSYPPYSELSRSMEAREATGLSAEQLFPETFRIGRDPFLGLPVSASVEKGLTITAVLEEVGLIGFAFFALMLGMLIRPVFRSAVGLAPAVLVLTGLLVNFGEAVFFAFGGTGLLIWLLIGYAYTEAETASHESGAANDSPRINGRYPKARAFSGGQN